MHRSRIVPGTVITQKYYCEVWGTAVLRARSGSKAIIGLSTPDSRLVRVPIVTADRSEWAVWIRPVRTRLNGWSGEIHRSGEGTSQQVRASSAPAFAAGARVWFVLLLQMQCCFFQQHRLWLRAWVGLFCVSACASQLVSRLPLP